MKFNLGKLLISNFILKYYPSHVEFETLIIIFLIKYFKKSEK